MVLEHQLLGSRLSWTKNSHYKYSIFAFSSVTVILVRNSFYKEISVPKLVVLLAGFASFILDFLTNVSGYFGGEVWVVPSDIFSSCICFAFKLWVEM